MEGKYQFGPVTEKDNVVNVKTQGKDSKVLIVAEQDIRLSFLYSGKVPDPRILIPIYQNMDVHDDDIFICAYMKCGTHWVWEMCQMLIKGKAEYHSEAKESCMLEFHMPEEFKDFERPRVFNTHFTPICLPTKSIEKRCKFIILRRNPKDVVTSMYHHMINTKINIDEDTTWSSFLQYIFDNDREVASNWFFYNKKWTEFIASNDLPVLVLNYEDIKLNENGICIYPEMMKRYGNMGFEKIRKQIIKTNTMDCLSKIANFINFPRDDNLLHEIIENCNISKMRDMEKERHPGSEVLDSQKVSGLYRKGVVGDWKEQFTVAENEQFDAFLRKYMNEEDLNFKYEI